MKTPPWASPTLSFRMASKESGKISEFFISGVNQDSFPKIMSGFAESIIYSMKFSLFILDRLTNHYQNSQGLASFDCCTMGEEAALGGQFCNLNSS